MGASDERLSYTERVQAAAMIIGAAMIIAQRKGSVDGQDAWHIAERVLDAAGLRELLDAQCQQAGTQRCPGEPRFRLAYARPRGRATWREQ